MAWFQSQKAVYSSTDGRNWERVPGEAEVQFSWTPWFAGAGGRSFAASIGSRPSVQASSDGASWTEVASSMPEGDRMSFAICGGGANQLFSVTSTGQTFLSTDGGAGWTEKARVRPEGARGSGGGFGGGCTFSPDHTKVLAQGWYFPIDGQEDSGPILALSEDLGSTWVTVPPPIERNDAIKVMMAGDAILYAVNDVENNKRVGFVYRSTDRGATWEKSVPLIAPGEEAASYSDRRSYATDGADLVVGIEGPIGDAEGDANYHGGIFYSADGGHSYE
ncbi:MAG: exo-alpha-sialidase, partial [Deltaproteobacteria bacterium]|nr:exo-alpha-sialidase [Deltaproteobacteria bacterium]